MAEEFCEDVADGSAVGFRDIVPEGRPEGRAVVRGHGQGRGGDQREREEGGRRSMSMRSASHSAWGSRGILSGSRPWSRRGPETDQRTMRPEEPGA